MIVNKEVAKLLGKHNKNHLKSDFIIFLIKEFNWFNFDWGNLIWIQLKSVEDRKILS